MDAGFLHWNPESLDPALEQDALFPLHLLGGRCLQRDSGRFQGDKQVVVAGLDSADAEGQVEINGGQDRIHRVRIGQVDLGVTGSAELGVIERAAEQALDRAVIVGSRASVW